MISHTALDLFWRHCCIVGVRCSAVQQFKFRFAREFEANSIINLILNISRQTSAMNGATISVRVYQSEVRAGSFVSGVVLLHVPVGQHLTCSGLEMRLFGQEKTETTHAGSSNRGSFTFLNEEHRLETNPISMIYSGEYEYPFKLSIPDGVPATSVISFDSNRVAVEYTLNVVTVGKDVVRGTAWVNVIRASVAVPLTFYALPQVSVLQTTARQVAGGSILVGGAVETISSSSYVKYAVVNRSTVKVKAVEATIVEEVTFSTLDVINKPMELVIFKKRLTSKEAELSVKSPPGSTETADLRLLNATLAGSEHTMLIHYQPMPSALLKDYQRPQGTYEGNIMKITYRLHIRVFMKNCNAEFTVCGGDFVLIPPVDPSIQSLSTAASASTSTSAASSPTVIRPFAANSAPSLASSPALPVARSTQQDAPSAAEPVAVAAPYQASSRSGRSSFLRSTFRSVFGVTSKAPPAEAEAHVAAAPGGMDVTAGVVVAMAAPAVLAPQVTPTVEQAGAVSRGVDTLHFSSHPGLESTLSMQSCSSDGGYSDGAVSRSVDHLIATLRDSISPHGALCKWLDAGHTADSLQPVHFFKIFAATKQPVEQLRLADLLSSRMRDVSCTILAEAAAGCSVSCKREVVQKLLRSGTLVDRVDNWTLVAKHFTDLERLTLVDQIVW